MFYLINLDVKQSRQANDSASFVKRAKERFRNGEIKKAQQEVKQERRDYRKKFESINKLFLSA